MRAYSGAETRPVCLSGAPSQEGEGSEAGCEWGEYEEGPADSHPPLPPGAPPLNTTANAMRSVMVHSTSSGLLIAALDGNVSQSLSGHAPFALLDLCKAELS
jgi:hypothetical protein